MTVTRMGNEPSPDYRGDASDEDGILEDPGSGCEPNVVSSEAAQEWNSKPSSPGLTTIVHATKAGILAFKDYLDGKPPEWLVRVWKFYGRKQVFSVGELDWQTEYDDLIDRIKKAVVDGLIDANTDVNGPFCTVILKPRTWEALVTATKEKPGPKSHDTQLTRTLEDGTRLVIDTRNLSGAVLSTPERAARSCLYWIDVFKDEESSPEMKTKMRMNLERADALWGHDLEEQNPGLYLQVMQALGHPEKAALNPIFTLDDMEAAC